MVDKYARAIAIFVNNYGWNEFSIIYDSSDSIARLQYVLQLGLKVNVYRLPKYSLDYKPILKEISRIGHNRIILDCKCENIETILTFAAEVNLKFDYVVSTE